MVAFGKLPLRALLEFIQNQTVQGAIKLLATHSSEGYDDLSLWAVPYFAYASYVSSWATWN